MVHFVGAGCGAPDLITVRGAKLLSEADVIIYAGSLVNPALLEYAEPPREGLVRDAWEYIAASERALPQGDFTPYEPGQRVDHAIMGPGTVIETDLARGAHVVKFDAMDTPRAISFKAKLEKLEE